MKILIVDDDPTVVDFFSQVATFEGHEDIDVAPSGEEALTQVVRTDYDLITLDVRMPGAIGLEILSLLRNLCPHAIIAIVSGHIPDEISSEVAGCADVMIDKPVSVETFVKLLRSTVRICEAREEILLLGSAPIVVR